MHITSDFDRAAPARGGGLMFRAVPSARAGAGTRPRPRSFRRARALLAVLAALAIAGALARPAGALEQLPEIETGIDNATSSHRVGSMSVIGYFGAGLGYDSNVLLTHANQLGSAFAIFVPGVRLIHDQDPNHVSMQMDYQGRAIQYEGQGNVAAASYMEQQFSLHTQWAPGPSQSLTFNEKAAYLTDPIEATTPRLQRFENETVAAAIYRGHTTDLRIQAGLGNERFSKALFRFLDTDSVNFEFQPIYHNFGPKATVDFDYQVEYFNLRDPDRSDLLVHYFLLGAGTPIGGNNGWVYSGEVGGCYMQTVSNLAAVNGATSLWSFATLLKADWTQNDPNTFLHFKLENRVEPSSFLQVTFANIYAIQASGSYAVNPQLVFSGAVSDKYYDQIATPIKLDQFQVVGSATYNGTFNLTYFARVTYLQVFAHYRDSRYTDLRIMGGATYAF
ncbi:MAG: hypothetical protein ACREJ2_06350 [Planctomycetota bacterium]